MGLIYLSVLLVAIAFLIVVIYLCFVLKRVTNTMKSLSVTLGEVEKQVQKITPELSATLKETDSLMDDVTEKVQATDSVFDSVQLLGESIQSANTAFQNSFGNLTDEEMDKKVKPFIEGIKWSEVGLTLFNQWKSKKPNDRNELMIRDDNEIAVTGREG
ncbi:DUF948 domain-containing protein [Oceanobacillus luteolus]|uniref:DUF948 domain-containing protein n=1 Tax=Oceanobacillus luteolus TaxID=1274358 RepID=UPI00203F2888|nr:DUF948 domain-containing protein [Oceanobacillus luteolus]MCM3741789.1 DUF948 domain-containing protein [Oceanobacillus luteolus]